MGADSIPPSFLGTKTTCCLAGGLGGGGKGTGLGGGEVAEDILSLSSAQAPLAAEAKDGAPGLEEAQANS